MDSVYQHVHTPHGLSRDLQKYHQKRDKRIQVVDRIYLFCLCQNEDILIYLTGILCRNAVACSPYGSGGWLGFAVVSGALTPTS